MNNIQKKAQTKINEIIKNKSILMDYLIECDCIIYNQLITKDFNNLVFKNIKTKKNRYVIYLLAEFYDLKRSENVLNETHFINTKKIDEINSKLNNKNDENSQTQVLHDVDEFKIDFYGIKNTIQYTLAGGGKPPLANTIDNFKCTYKID